MTGIGGKNKKGGSFSDGTHDRPPLGEGFPDPRLPQ
jgi:hypothetical protein